LLCWQLGSSGHCSNSPTMPKLCLSCRTRRLSSSPLRKPKTQQGLFAPQALPRFVATAGPSATLSPFRRLPGSASYTASLLPSISRPGRVGFLQLLSASLSSCRSNPARVSRRVRQFATFHAASPHEGRLGLWAETVSRPVVRSLSLRTDDSLTIREMALSIGFQNLVSLLPTIQATGLWLLPW